MFSKLAQYAHYLLYIGECIVACRDVKGVLELEYKIWKAENERRFIRSSLHVQLHSGAMGPPDKSGKAVKVVPSASALRISNDATERAMLRNPKTRAISVAFEEELNYINSMETRAMNMYWSIQCASRSNGLLTKLINNVK